MLKAVVMGIAVAVGFGGAALAQTGHIPAPADPLRPLLVKHDKDEDGHGRKLGHYKKHGDDEDEDEDEDRGRRSSARQSRGSYAPSYAPSWVNPAPSPYYRTPGYGNSYPPSYGYPQPPYYYRGY